MENHHNSLWISSVTYKECMNMAKQRNMFQILLGCIRGKNFNPEVINVEAEE